MTQNNSDKIEEAIVNEQKRIAVRMAESTDLSHREIGYVIDRTAEWVSRAVREEKSENVRESADNSTGEADE